MYRVLLGDFIKLAATEEHNKLAACVVVAAAADGGLAVASSYLLCVLAWNRILWVRAS